jgi:hypothetical protein
MHAMLRWFIVLMRVTAACAGFFLSGCAEQKLQQAQQQLATDYTTCRATARYNVPVPRPGRNLIVSDRLG